MPGECHLSTITATRLLMGPPSLRAPRAPSLASNSSPRGSNPSPQGPTARHGSLKDLPDASRDSAERVVTHEGSLV